jgi:hypothetical protein
MTSLHSSNAYGARVLLSLRRSRPNVSAVIAEMSSIDRYLRGAEQPLLTTNLRFFGFVNDIGEALHAYLPKPLYIGSFVSLCGAQSAARHSALHARAPSMPPPFAAT